MKSEEKKEIISFDNLEHSTKATGKMALIEKKKKTIWMMMTCVELKTS